MIYITIILVAIIISCCILGWQYIAFKNNPELYKKDYVIQIIQECTRLLEKYDAYDLADDEVKYNYIVETRDVKETLYRILEFANYKYKENE